MSYCRETSSARQRIRRNEQIDRSLPHNNGAKSEAIDFGLAVLSAIALPGVCYTRDEIARFCGCTESAIYQIELRALKKLRHALHFRPGSPMKDMLVGLFEERETAKASPLHRGGERR